MRMKQHEIQGYMSRYEVLDADGTTRYAPQTAHEGASDEGYTLHLPQSCDLCKTQEKVVLPAAPEAP